MRKAENPDDVVVKVTVPDRWPMPEARRLVGRAGGGAKARDQRRPHPGHDGRGTCSVRVGRYSAR